MEENEVKGTSGGTKVETKIKKDEFFFKKMWPNDKILI